MTSQAIISVRCTEDERPVWERMLSDLNAALQGACTVSLTWPESLDAAAQVDAGIVCLSMLPDLWRQDTDWPTIEAQWREAASALRSGVMAQGIPVFVVTIFRHLAPEDSASLPRLRRLNLLAAQLSQEFGLFVIDLDRVLAHRGGLELGTDARLGGALGQRVAADTIGDTLLGTGIDHLVDDAAVQQAIEHHRRHREAGQSRLSVPQELMRLERTRVKSRTQVFGIQRDLIDDRSLAGLLRDVRAGRVGPAELVRQVASKLSERLGQRR